MDRRQILVGMTAMGVAGSLNLNELLRAQNVASATKNTAARYAHMSDGERKELLGPVKMCVEESPSLVTTKEYGPDGKVVTIHTEHDGKPLYSSSDSVYSEERDDQGRILRFSSPNREGAIKETSYDYHEKTGRLLTITNNQDSDRTVFKYTADGMTSIQTFDPKTIEETRNAAFCGVSAWEASAMGFGVPMGGIVTTTYDKSDNPIELQIHTPDGQRITRMVRNYDAEGRLKEERTLEKNMTFLMLERKPPEQRAQLGPNGIQALSERLNHLGMRPDGATYEYDSQGRVKKKFERNTFFEHTTIILYNEHGDKAREIQTFKDNTVGPEHPRYIPPDGDIRYSYQYDNYGNWTEKIETRDDGSSVTTRRTISYYY
jgi:hypothetical protein